MISFQWRNVSIAVSADGQLTIQGSVPAKPESLEALGDVLVAMAQLVAVDSPSHIEFVGEAGITTTPAPVIGAAAVSAAPVDVMTAAATKPPNAAPRAAAVATSTSLPVSQVTPLASAGGGIVKPGPKRTAAWLNGEAVPAMVAEGPQPVATILPAAQAAAGMNSGQVTAANVTAPNVTAPNVTAPNVTAPNVTAPNVTAPKYARRSPATGATVVVRGLVKPGPKRTAAFLSGDLPAEESLLNQGLMAPAAASISKPGPSQTRVFLSQAAANEAEPNRGDAPLADLLEDDASLDDDASLAEGDASPDATAAVLTPASAATAVTASELKEQPRRAVKGHLVREMQRWLEAHGRAATVAELVKAAVAEDWSLATNVEPVLVGALRRNGKVFRRNMDGTFSLQAARGPGKVVRRRAERHPDDV